MADKIVAGVWTLDETKTLNKVAREKLEAKDKMIAEAFCDYMGVMLREEDLPELLTPGDWVLKYRWVPDGDTRGVVLFVYGVPVSLADCDGDIDVRQVVGDRYRELVASVVLTLKDMAVKHCNYEAAARYRDLQAKLLRS